MRRFRRSWLSSIIFVATLGAVVRVAAEEPPATTERPENGYWSVGKPRLFLSTRSEFGVPYAKPYVSAGYGLPHWIWTGVDVNSILTMDCFQVYGGVRAATPILDLAFGVRDTWSFSKPFLAPRDAYTSDQ